MCSINKSAHTKKSGNIFNDPRICTVKKVNFVTLVEGDLKAPFSIATTPRCKEGRYSIPWIAPLYS